MKKNKLKSLVESARKGNTKIIEAVLITELNKLSVNLELDSKKLSREIKKGSKLLAKKLSNKIKIDKSALIEAKKKKADTKDAIESQTEQTKSPKVIISSAPVSIKPVRKPSTTVKSAVTNPIASAIEKKDGPTEDVASGLN